MAIIISSTMSDSGKSFVTTGLVRLLNGIPFKAQNMSLNSFPSVEGGEIAFIQSFQAIGREIEPHNYMNPVLLKPSGKGIEVILYGKSLGNLNPQEYYSMVPEIWEKRIKKELKENMIIEGAGGLEPNFLDRDITTIFPMREGIPAILVLDIDRGGAFSSAYGAYEMLPPSLRDKLKGFIINKFRGEKSFLNNAINWLEEKTGMKFLGAIPYLDKNPIMAEDSMNIKEFGDGEMNVAIISYPYMSNFNEFQALEKSNASVTFVNTPKKAEKADLIILPGTRNTFESLIWLKERGFIEVLKKKPVLGICGGFQIMGKKLIDPYGIESGIPREYQGLGFFDFEVKFDKEKIVSISEAENNQGKIIGYEIRRGKITYYNDKPFLEIKKRNNVNTNIPDGAIKENKIGYSIHGSLYNSRILEEFNIKIYSKSLKSEIIEMATEVEKIIKDNVDIDKVKELYY
ncbi:cobyric acid synthase [Acidianus sulfidivorans JP7]|uniref:Probable cobyric acid synthase n=1 Tax=Acidianus sulfidivorans JP7 TaxID=619593 RepID=A0A2U9INE2_9CREN|nr:cobyric acid synthase [Acidianus sulfidivorans]AWR97516.1 cobyric acid synthase [Acidianus sulfidivorans JP7]